MRIEITTVKLHTGGQPCEFHDGHCKATKELSFNDEQVDSVVINGILKMSNEPLVLCDECADEILEVERESRAVIISDISEVDDALDQDALRERISEDQLLD